MKTQKIDFRFLGIYTQDMVKRKMSKKQPSVSERHSGVVLEDIDSKLDLVIEGYEGLDKKIDKVDKKVDKLDEKVNRLDGKIDKVDKKLEDFRNEVDYKFEVVFEKFDDITDELRVIRNELKEKVSRDEFALLEKRVMALEKSRK